MKIFYPERLVDTGITGQLYFKIFQSMLVVGICSSTKKPHGALIILYCIVVPSSK